jgi:rod shape-determining protein MreC
MNRLRQRALTFGVLIGIGLLLVFLSRAGALRPLITVLIAPLQSVERLFTAGSRAVGGGGAERLTYNELVERNRELEAAVASLQVEVVRLREIEQDHERLSGLLDYASSHEEQSLVTGDVVARETSGFLRYIIINRGARDGVEVGDPVITDMGLVGRVADVTATAAWVRLAVDQGSAVNARLQDARAEGTVVGQLQGGLRMQHIPREAVIEEGDLVLTSGLGGNFPAGIVIGQVVSVRQQVAELFQEAEIRPTVDFDHLEIVSVVTDFEPIDLSAFDETIEEGGEEPE